MINSVVTDWRQCDQVDLRSCWISRLAGLTSPFEGGQHVDVPSRAGW
jgi:hypothetical protein